MASDDDKRWQDAQYDAKMRADLARRQSNRLFDAIISGNEDIARDTVGVPPAGGGSGRADEADAQEDTEPPTPDKLFRTHRNDLLFNLRWAQGFLPQEYLENWMARVERLDLQEAEAGLPAIEAIRDEYQHAANRYKPDITRVSRNEVWDYYVPRIGHEIEWLIRLFQHVLTLR